MDSLPFRSIGMTTVVCYGDFKALQPIHARRVVSNTRNIRKRVRGAADGLRPYVSRPFVSAVGCRQSVV